MTFQGNLTGKRGARAEGGIGEGSGGWFRQNPYQRIPGLQRRTVLTAGGGWGTHYSVILRVEQTARMERRGVVEKDAERGGEGGRKERGGERCEKGRFLFLFFVFFETIKIPVTKRRSLGRAFNSERSAGLPSALHHENTLKPEREAWNGNTEPLRYFCEVESKDRQAATSSSGDHGR